MPVISFLLAVAPDPAFLQRLQADKLLTAKQAARAGDEATLEFFTGGGVGVGTMCRFLPTPAFVVFHCVTTGPSTFEWQSFAAWERATKRYFAPAKVPVRGCSDEEATLLPREYGGVLYLDALRCNGLMAGWGYYSRDHAVFVARDDKLANVATIRVVVDHYDSADVCDALSFDAVVKAHQGKVALTQRCYVDGHYAQVSVFDLE